MLEIQNLNFYFKKDKTILNDITSALSPGKIYGLLGLNGEGKTTFLKLLSGILFPKSGNITLNSTSSTDRGIRFFEQIYLLPDQPISSSLTINKFIEIYSPFYKYFSNGVLNQALQDLHVDTKSTIKSLSFGQQKKFQLAFAIAANTKYLFLDEPTNGLDIPSKTIVRKLLARSINDDKTILISTHLVKDVENLIDHILILKDGKLALDMSTLAITSKYRFNFSNQAKKEALYTESVLSNYKTISCNIAEEESNIDIELLFNAIQQGKL